MRARYMHEQLVTVGAETLVVEHDYVHSAPMVHVTRLDAYYRQNGYRPLTARQHRQVERLRRAYCAWLDRHS